MTERPSHTQSDDEAPMRVDRGSAASPQRWLGVVGIVITLVILTFVVMHLTGVMGSGGH
jgi:hypothetical protein